VTQEDDLGLHGASADEELVNRGLGPLILRKVIASILVKTLRVNGSCSAQTVATRWLCHQIVPSNRIFNTLLTTRLTSGRAGTSSNRKWLPGFISRGGQQFRIINECGETGDVAELVRWGYLRRIN
jgi:hypothetical protein